jgi:hypothetical protein
MIGSFDVAVVESTSAVVTSPEEGMDEAPGASPLEASSLTMVSEVVVGGSDLPGVERSAVAVGPSTARLEIC